MKLDSKNRLEQKANKLSVNMNKPQSAPSGKGPSKLDGLKAQNELDRRNGLNNAYMQRAREPREENVKVKMELAKADLRAVEMGRKVNIEPQDTSKESSITLQTDNEDTPASQKEGSTSSSQLDSQATSELQQTVSEDVSFETRQAYEYQKKYMYEDAIDARKKLSANLRQRQKSKREHLMAKLAASGNAHIEEFLKEIVTKSQKELDQLEDGDCNFIDLIVQFEKLGLELRYDVRTEAERNRYNVHFSNDTAEGAQTKYDTE